MFGYIRAAKPEMKIKDFEIYKAVYCSLCRSLGKNYGLLSRFTLSYDFTFLAVLNMAMKEGCRGIERKCCAFNPLKKCNYSKNTQDLQMPSAAAMIMLYYKLKDNIDDEKGFKKVGAFCLLPFFSFAHNKAKRQYPVIEEAVENYIAKQKELENRNECSIDKACDPTAIMLSKILMLCSNDQIQKRVLERLGYCLGRYIYLLDAACDLQDDIKHNSYNVFKNAVTGDIKPLIEERVLPQLYFCVNEAARALELLDIKKYKSILENIIYLGLEETFKKELEI